MAKPKHFISLDSLGNESQFGRNFVDPGTGAFFDTSSMSVVSFRTDTVRQLYRGRLKSSVLELFEKPGLINFDGYTWYAGRIGRDSGYQYQLQNADLGIILLIKSFHSAPEHDGNHLKIEVSPHFIHSHTELELQFKIDCFADAVLHDWSHGGCAVHMAADVQGWKPSGDFETRLHCRSRRVRSFHGVDSFDVDNLSARYGRGESFLFGSASGMQLAVYDKTDEAKARDKLDYWRSTWSNSPAYDPESTVTRVELRFHHSVINQFGDGTVDTSSGEQFDMSSYKGVYSHLSALWRYGLDSFRLLHRPGYFDPAWSVLDRLAVPDVPDCIDYKRHYKKADTFSGKNIELLLGNFISCATRHRMTARAAWEAVQAMPFYTLIREYYELKDKDETDLKRHLYRLMSERRIRYGRAV